MINHKMKENTQMSDEKLNFMDMLSMIRVIDDDDRARKFKDCIESCFQEVSKKVAEYGRDGSLVINLKFQCDKKNKTGINIFAEVNKKIPKGQYSNPFYRDTRTGGIYLEDPQQLKMFNNVTKISQEEGEV